jgi:hypothetical protein
MRSRCHSKKELQDIIKKHNESTKDGVSLYGTKGELCDRLDALLRRDSGAGMLCKKIDGPSYWARDPGVMTTSTLNSTMKRFESPRFVFLGVFPRDFTERNENGRCVGSQSPTMCPFDVAPLARDKKCFGLILNTHPHTQGGEHWVCIFCDTDAKSVNYGIRFYDSYGKPPNSHAAKFMKSISVQMSDDSNFVMSHNTYKHQEKDMNCGIFCMALITHCAAGGDFKKYCASGGVTDKYIRNFKRKMFKM